MIRHLPLWLLILSVLALGTATHTAAQSQSLGLGVGWNLVALPPGTNFTFASVQGPLYTLQPGDAGYEPADLNGGTAAGLGYWLYEGQPGSAKLGSGVNAPYSVTVPAGQWVRIGDPSGTEPATVTGADVLEVYGPSYGAVPPDFGARPEPAPRAYLPVPFLPLVVGAWAYSAAGGTITVTPSAQEDAPTITSITPDSGPGGTTVAIQGRRFGAASTCNPAPCGALGAMDSGVRFGNALIPVLFWSDTQILVRAPVRSQFPTGPNASLASGPVAVELWNYRISPYSSRFAPNQASPFQIEASPLPALPPLEPPPPGTVTQVLELNASGGEAGEIAVVSSEIVRAEAGGPGSPPAWQPYLTIYRQDSGRWTPVFQSPDSSAAPDSFQNRLVPPVPCDPSCGEFDAVALVGAADLAGSGQEPVDCRVRGTGSRFWWRLGGRRARRRSGSCP